MAIKVIVTNKKAYHNFHLLDKWECGIALVGPEVKSLRAGHASFTDAFANTDKGELFLHNLHINPYQQASFMNQEVDRPRKLLLHKKELKRLMGIVQQKGLTIVPLKLYNKNAMVKIEIGIARGKRVYEKREKMKKRTAERDIEREMKSQSG